MYITHFSSVDKTDEEIVVNVVYLQKCSTPNKQATQYLIELSPAIVCEQG